MDWLFKTLDLVGSTVAWLSAGKLDRQIERLLTDALNHEEYSNRKFSTLLHDSAIYEDNPKELRKVLIRLGARRYRDLEGEELWGFPKRNTESKSDEPYPFVRTGTVLALLGAALLFVSASLYQFIVEAIDVEFVAYECDETGDEISPGFCYPAQGSNNIPASIRKSLYIVCRFDGGNDRYTSNCCDHLTNVDAIFLGVCAANDRAGRLNSAIYSGASKTELLREFASE